MNISTIKLRFKQSDIAQRLASGAFWSFSGTAIAKFLVLVAGMICAHILGKDRYGEFGMIRSTITVFVTLGIAGLGLTATKFISEFRKKSPERISSIYIITTTFSIILGIIISILIIVLAPVIADKTLNSPYLTNDLKWGGILLFFTILNGIQNGVLTGFEKFKIIAINNLYGSVAEGILMCLGAYYYGVTGAIIGYGCGYVVIYLSNRVSISKIFLYYNINPSLRDLDKRDLNIIYKFSLPAALSALMTAPVFWIVRSMLVRTDGYGQLAIYEAADQWKIIILFIPTAISNVALPILSSLVNNSRAKFWKMLKLNIALNASIAFILTVSVALLGNYLMKFYGKGFDNPIPLIILSSSTVFTAIATVIGLSISSRGKMWIGFSFNFCWGIMVIGLTFLFLKMGLGATGLALAILCSYALHASAQYIYLRYSFKDIP